MKKIGPCIDNILCLLFLCGVLLLTTGAEGQELAVAQAPTMDVSSEDSSRERCSDPEALLSYHADAKRLVAEQRYAAAIATFERAYAMCPQAVFLRNLAICHQRIGAYQTAIAFYRRYIAESKEQRFISESFTNIRILTTLLEQQSSLERERKRPLYRRASFWGLLGAGVVTLTGIAVAVGITSSPQSFDLSWPR